MKNSNKRRKPSAKDKVAVAIAGWIVGTQVYLSQKLKAWERRQQPGRKKMLFLFFMVVGFGYCSYILLDALFRSTTVSISGESLPKPTPLPDTPHTKTYPAAEQPQLK